MSDEMTPASREVARAVVDEQAEDEGLWFVAQTVAEAYLQAALRRLHAAVEGESLSGRVSVPVEPVAEVAGPFHVVCRCDKCAAAPPAEGK